MKNLVKKIHFVWFGGKKPEMTEKCIESWKKFLPDWQIIEWNEKNFDINSHPFVKEAIERKKYAFASDYIRLWALQKFGGLYFDTDMELLKDPTALLTADLVMGWEDANVVGSAFIYCKPNNPVIQKFLSYYDDRHFVDQKGKTSETPNTFIFSAIFKHGYKIKSTGNKIVEKQGVKIYPPDYLYPKDPQTRKINITENSHAIHHFDGSWWVSNKKRPSKFMFKIQRPFQLAGLKLFFGRLWRGCKNKLK